MNLKYIIEICIGIDIAIIGIAYPIIIDKISNIGNRYDSNYLSEVFEQEISTTGIWSHFAISEQESYHFRMAVVLHYRIICLFDCRCRTIILEKLNMDAKFRKIIDINSYLFSCNILYNLA